MSKGLEALEIIKHTTDLDRPNELNGYHDEICDIEKELKEKEQYEKILKDYGLTLANFREACLLLAMLKGEGRNIHNISKQLKALEIFKNRSSLFMRCIDREKQIIFNDFVINCKNKEEYKLLKEVLL